MGSRRRDVSATKSHDCPCIPSEPEFIGKSERVVWGRLRPQLRPQDIILANVRLTDERSDHEADFFVLMPAPVSWSSS
jgi:hypothetical protein